MCINRLRNKPNNMYSCMFVGNIPRVPPVRQFSPNDVDGRCENNDPEKGAI